MVAVGCSSSLLAVHLACQGLINGDCDIAITGGITLDVLPISAKTDIWNQLGITGPAVRCRAFDDNANGISKGEGCGVIILKLLKTALADKDHIYGVLHASFANHDGHSNGITAPHPSAQADLLINAWERARITPDLLGYFEAHGTGTALGDPIEIKGIQIAYDKVMKGFKSSSNRIPIGSLKSNIGHLADGAAGIMSLIKVLLCFHYDSIPASIHFVKPNHFINWQTARVQVCSKQIDWPKNDRARYASVSSFGLLGTNVHVVVADAHEYHTFSEPLLEKQSIEVLAISADTKESVVKFSRVLVSFIDRIDCNKSCLRSFCYTLTCKREHDRFEHRAIVLARSWAEMKTELHMLLSTDRNDIVTDIDATLVQLYSKGHGYLYQHVSSKLKTNTRASLVEHLGSFLKGATLSCNEFYEGAHHMPLLPNYCFEKHRFWPDVQNKTMINAHLLHLEHKSNSNDHMQVQRQLTESKTKVYEILEKALDDAIGDHLDWSQSNPDGQIELVQVLKWGLPMIVREHHCEEATALAHYIVDYKTEFDLTKGPLVRCNLYHLDEQSFLFTVVAHHIIFDGWSHFIMQNEIWRNYKLLMSDEVIDRRLQLPLYAEYESQKICYATELVYWTSMLKKHEFTKSIPGDLPRPPIFSNNGKRITTFIPIDLIRALNRDEVCRYSIFTQLLSVVYLLMYKFTHKTALIVGTPIAGRQSTLWKHVIGFFVNTLAIGIKLQSEALLFEFFKLVQKTCADAFDNSVVPFDEIVAALDPPRDTSQTPIFNINVCYHNTEAIVDHVEPPSEIHLQRILPHNDSAKWDLYFDFLHETRDNTFRFTLEYYSDLYTDVYAQDLVNTFIDFLHRITHVTGAMTIEDFLSYRTQEPLVNGCSSENKLNIFWGPSVNNGSISVCARLVEQFISKGSITAIMSSKCEQIYSYSSLLRRLSDLACFLRKECQLSLQTRVGVLVDHSHWSVTSALSILMSGLTLVPLDSQSPFNRLEKICNNTGIQALVYSVAHLRNANRLLWSCNSLKTIVCIGERDVQVRVESLQHNALSDTELWDAVATSAGTNDIAGGGWKNSYDQTLFSEEEMNEYAINTEEHLRPYLTPELTVLEIGCGSGYTTRAIAPHVKHYVATDSSAQMIATLRVKLNTSVYPMVTFETVSAISLKEHFAPASFDLIILNSVVHCFPGHNYMTRVFHDCVRLLKPGGSIFIGDVMDLEKREEFIASLHAYQQQNPSKNTKLNWENELFLMRGFFEQLCSSINGQLTVLSKIGTIENELKCYRYDIIITVKGLSKPSVLPILSKMSYDWSDIDGKGSTDELECLSKEVALTNEAYILFTSGTTGQPCGVVVDHCALLNYILWACETYQMTPQDCMPFFSPLTFDFTITSLICPLITGGKLAVFDIFQRDYQQIADSNFLTIAKFTPLQLSTLLSVARERLSEKRFILGGEELNGELLNSLKRCQVEHPFIVWNEYGPTECTVGCVVKKITSEEAPWKSVNMSIGYPIQNTFAAIVDDKNYLVPPNTRGRLCLGGFCSTRILGHDRAHMEIYPTKMEAFLTDDIAQYNSESNEILHFGRVTSHTAKLNGIRIDLKEIEKCLKTVSGIHEVWPVVFENNERQLLGVVFQAANDQQNHVWTARLVAQAKSQLSTVSVPSMWAQQQQKREQKLMV
ncbi:unnamed protein product [Rotaria sp. Silwood1]|nr:unnamed protein product [Rotaria sp. Silwood1]CAF3807808.1 unnamed protein product [Rotaria sp. Silwood1]CAF4888383.1 unnamed protein product [Rotaria sp. Silwood1]CAF4901166.1 unnamed protein product [Rotaria sp. Silwood1]